MRIIYLSPLLLLLAFSMATAQKGITSRALAKLYKKGQLNQNILLKNTSSINTARLEFSPVLYQNGLVYVSNYKSGPVDEKTGETFFELFYSEMDRNGMPLKPQSFSAEINSQLHEGPVSFNRTGDKIYFTRNNQEQGLSRADSKNKVGLKIYEARKGYFDWEKVTALSFNDDDYNCVHPSLSYDESKLFFSSNMPGGYGGMDLYVAIKQGAGWSKPINLGPEINTEKNELFPFIHQTGTLFFASDGHQVFGGLDLFMIDMSEKKWGTVINLGQPFNSPLDDLGLVLTKDGKRGYFASDREGGFGKDDIYVFEAPDGIQGLELPELMHTRIIVYDAGSSKRAQGVAIRIFERSQDGLINNEELYNLEIFPTTGNGNEMVLRLVRKKDDELGDPKIVTNRNGEAIAQFAADKDYLILASKAGYSTKEINYSTRGKEDNSLPLEILIHPKNCLSLNGIVLSEGYSNRVPNAVVTIINHCNGGEEVTRSNINGEFEFCLPIGCDFIIRGEKAGYDPGSSQVSTVKIRGSRSIAAEIRLRPNSDAVIKEPIREGTVIVLENIYYDFNKSAIRAGEARDLEALTKLMKLYPSMEIALGAHTDSRGTEAYNLKLSLKRAESAKSFLLRRGIVGHRIKAFGYGEAYIRNRCVDGVGCSEEEHQYNRRTEVKVTRIDEPIEIEQGKDRLQFYDKNKF